MPSYCLSFSVEVPQLSKHLCLCKFYCRVGLAKEVRETKTTQKQQKVCSVAFSVYVAEQFLIIKYLLGGGALRYSAVAVTAADNRIEETN